MIPFSKYHGLGNDYLFLDAIKNTNLLHLPFNDLVKTMSHRRLGPGSDGIVVFMPSTAADIKMRIFNPDGSEAESCGNALRCIGRICHERSYINTNTLTVETLGGIVTVIVPENDPEYKNIAVDMGVPSWIPEDHPMCHTDDPLHFSVEINGKQLDTACLSVGNPHCVVFMPEYTIETVKKLGPLVEAHESFPRKINAGFCRIVNHDTIELTVWERGAGLTGACGTGATAAFAAAHKRGHINKRCAVVMPGGTLSFELDDRGAVRMIGPAEFVYHGSYPSSSSS